MKSPTVEKYLSVVPSGALTSIVPSTGKDLKNPEDLNDPESTAKLQTVYDALRSLEIDALISIGGDDTLTTAAKFRLFQETLPPDQKRIRVVHLPKTIDNDYEGIDFTFGY